MSNAKNFAYFLLITSGLLGFSNAQAKYNISTDYSADQLTLENSIQKPRSVIRDDSGDILVLSQETSQVQAIYTDKKDNAVKTTIIIDGATLGLNHGLTYNNGYLYASTSSNVLRWGYQPGQRTRVAAKPEIVVKQIPADGDYLTRSLIIDRFNALYVSVGSAGNSDESEDRAQIRKFNLAEGFPDGGYDYNDGEVFAKGVRNAVGLAFDQNNTLWGVDCGADELYREDLGGNIHDTNPADELIRFDVSSASYGFPYCWTVDELEGHQKGQQYAWLDYMNDSVHTDAWCQNTKNNQPPTLTLPAHNAPLGLIFYDGIGCGSEKGSFPCSMKGDLFVAFHGSTNREPPSGYKVVRIPIHPDTHLPTGKMEDIIVTADTTTCVIDPSTCLRPVDLVFSQTGHLIVSSDSSNEIIRISHNKGANDDDSSDSEFISIVKKTLHVPGIIAIVIIVILTLALAIMTIRAYGCRACRRTEDIPYMQENI